MRKALIGLMVLALVATGVLADAERMSGEWPLSKDWVIYNTTLRTAETVYTVTLADPTVSINVQAKGGDIRMVKDGTTTEAFWTIGQDQCLWDHLPTPMPASKILYFYSKTNMVTVEVLHNHR
jgi:hypothetical protein